MSLENVQIAKRGIDAFNTRDLDALAKVTTTDFEWLTPFVKTIEGVSFRGRQGIDAYFRDSRGTWEVIQVVADKWRDLGNSVLVLGRIEGRGIGSGALVGAPFGALLDLRAGKISRSHGYLDHGEALRAAGLEG
jgi:ketosteroid isomerase-like protein